MARISRKELLKDDEFVEAAFDLQHWLEHNWRTLLKFVIPVVVLVLVAVAWINIAARAAERNRMQLAAAIHEFQQAEQQGFADFDRLAAALDGFDNCVDKLGNEPAGQVARYYRGVTLHRLGRNDEAIEALETVEIPPDSLPTLGAAKALLADLLVENGDVERAVSLLTELADGSGSGYPAEMALLQLGRIQRGQGSEEAARASWDRIVTEFPESAAAQEATRLLGS